MSTAATGAGAEEAGRLLAKRLGFRYVNEQIVEQAAARAGVSRDAVDQVEHRQPLVTRIMQMLATTTPPDAAGWAPDLIPLADPSPTYRALIQDVIRQTAAEGNAVIVAHAAGILLAGTAGVVRVVVTASPEVRAERAAAERGSDAREAQRTVERAEQERAAYLERFYGIRHELPTHYDLVINTDALTPEDAARLIACAAGA